MNENALMTMPDNEFSRIIKIGEIIAKSRLYGVENADQAIALIMQAHADGSNIMEAVRDYHIIKGRASLKADAMLARFQRAGGSVKWGEYTEKTVTGTFSHPQGGSVDITWTIDMARRAGLAEKDNWKNYPRAMLAARCISEGIHKVYPGACVGLYTEEEVSDMNPEKPAPDMDVILPEQSKPAAEQETVIAKTEDEYRAEAKRIAEDLVLSDARVKELWRDSAHDYPAFIALLKAEPQGMMF